MAAVRAQSSELFLIIQANMAAARAQSPERKVVPRDRKASGTPLLVRAPVWSPGRKKLVVHMLVN
jgi:hypothetical protein